MEKERQESRSLLKEERMAEYRRITAYMKSVCEKKRAACREMKELEDRLGLVNLLGSRGAKETKYGRGTIPKYNVKTRAFHFVVSACEMNGGLYPMAQLRGVIKGDTMEFYRAMGKPKKFANRFSAHLTLEKIHGVWYFVLRHHTTLISLLGVDSLV